MNNPPYRYYHGLDMLRAGLMLIGVFWHAVSVLSPAGNFVYASEIHQSKVLYGLVYPEHIFRMEAFFLVSGFLSQMVLVRKGKAAFWQARWKRVALPLLLGCLGVNFLLQLFGSQFMGYKWANYDLWRWVMHGWFLITLFMCALVDLALPKHTAARTGKLGLAFVAIIGWLGYIALITWNARSWHLGGNIATLYNFTVLATVQYFPFYFAGAWLYHHQSLLDRIRPRTLWIIAAVMLVTATINYLGAMKIYKLFATGTQWDFVLYRANAMLAAGSIAFLLFWFFYRIQQGGSAVVRYLMTSAIVIYLVHHPLVIIFGWAFDHPALSNLSYYLLLVGVTIAASYVLYEIIRRVNWLRIAFGLKPQR
ncbi:acyltransferase family protein [Cardiobacteriaceae bacterium TAE3-ERU3]|nr:acyltransferase family protein [Cardiobacteriaceae bacterium TAE3-ERU3]